MINQKTVTLVAIFAMFGCTLWAADNRSNDTVIEKLQGRWQIVSGVNQGRQLSEAELSGSYVTITTNTIVTYDRDEQQKFRAVFRTDDSQKPIHITMNSVALEPSTDSLKINTTSSEPVAAGILKFVNGDQWILCYSLPGAERPKTFESTKGSKTMLFTMRKDEGDPAPDLLSADPSE